jgi:nucleoside-diphosphate-sugar epimerase
MIDKSKRILITWANWFVWANLVRTLVKLWFENIYIIIRKESNLWRINDIIAKLNIDYVSLINENELSKYINIVKPEIIYHLAAAGAYIWRDWRWIKDLFDFNVMWTINLINACKEVWFEYFINTWSNSEYWQKNLPMKETDLLEPNNDYWITKASATLYASNIWKKFNLPVYTFRLFAVFWYFEDKTRLIPSIILKYLNNESPNLSKPDSVRDFIFIDDVINYYLNTDKIKWDYWWVFNIWNWKQYNIDEIVWIIKRIDNKSINPTYWTQTVKQNEPKVWMSDNSKAINIFWFNHNSVEDWLEKTYEWLKNNNILYK